MTQENASYQMLLTLNLCSSKFQLRMHPIVNIECSLCINIVTIKMLRLSTSLLWKWVSFYADVRKKKFLIVSSPPPHRHIFTRERFLLAWGGSQERSTRRSISTMYSNFPPPITLSQIESIPFELEIYIYIYKKEIWRIEYNILLQLPHSQLVTKNK